MSPAPVETYASLVGYFVLIGLLLDMLGAILVIGPDLPALARVFTTLERRRLKRLVNRLRENETLTSEVRGFSDLQTAVGQGHVEGETGRPFDPESDGDPMEFFWQFDEIEGLDDCVEIRVDDGGGAARFQYDDLESWVRNFTA